MIHSHERVKREVVTARETTDKGCHLLRGLGEETQKVRRAHGGEGTILLKSKK